MDRLRVGIVGLGKMGLVHSCILSTIPCVEITALCEKSRVLRKIAKKLFKNSTIVDEVEKLCSSSIDCAYVTAPIPAHYPIVNALYSSNITKIFVEKTLGSNWKEANEICLWQEKKHEIGMVGYMKRFSTTFCKGKSLIEENEIGKIHSFKASAYSSDFKGLTSASGSLSRGGVLSDLGSHIIDLALWYFGDFKVDQSSLTPIPEQNYKDQANFKVMNTDLTGEFDISWCKDNYRMPNFELTVQGNKGTLTVNDYTVILEKTGNNRIDWFRTTLNDNVPFLLGDPEYYREDNYFINSIINGSKPEPSFKTASKVDGIISQVKKECYQCLPA